MLLHARQIAIQTAALLIYLALAWPYFGFRGEELPWPASAYAVGAIALVVACIARQPWWWRLIHLIFVPPGKPANLALSPAGFCWADRLAAGLSWRHRRTHPAFSSERQRRCPDRNRARKTGSPTDRPWCRHRQCGRAARHRKPRPSPARQNAPASWLLGYLRTRGLKTAPGPGAPFGKPSSTRLI